MSAKILSTVRNITSLRCVHAVGNDIEGDSMSSEVPLFYKPYINSYQWYV